MEKRQQPGRLPGSKKSAINNGGEGAGHRNEQVSENSGQGAQVIGNGVASRSPGVTISKDPQPTAWRTNSIWELRSTATSAIDIAAATGEASRPLSASLATFTAINLPRASADSTSPSKLVRISEEPQLNSGAVIGITLGSLVLLILVAFFIDVIRMNNRLIRLFKKLPLTRFRDRSSLLPTRETSIKRKPLASPVVPHYNKEIKHSRTLSLDSSGYSSRYSRSTWGWSGDGTKCNRSSKEILRASVMEERKNYQRYSVFDDDDDDLEIRWEEKAMTYVGNIKLGMGVQRRYTGGSLDLESGDLVEEIISSKQPRKGRLKNVTWFLQDPLERWKKGIHPLSGRRGAEFTRIGYYN